MQLARGAAVVDSCHVAHRSRAAWLLVVLGVLAATPGVAQQTRQFAITEVNIVDVTNGQITPARTVVINGDVVSAITGSAPPPGTQTFDGRGKFLIPGLWDMHAHMEIAGESWLQLYVANGVTGIRDMGSSLDVILPMREATASGRVLGPRIVAAGPILPH